MSKKSVSHEYLEYVKNGSNKFYVVIEPGNGKCLVGYGSRSAGTSGNWREVTTSEARKLVSEKLGKGYQKAAISSMPSAALNEASARHKAAVGTPLTLDRSGALLTDDTSTPQPAQGPLPAPRQRQRGHGTGAKQLKAWF